jgi:hypothetical protein
MIYLAIRYWDDDSEEEVLGEFDTKEAANAACDKDFEEYGSNPFMREHVLYRVDQEKR